MGRPDGALSTHSPLIASVPAVAIPCAAAVPFIGERGPARSSASGLSRPSMFLIRLFQYWNEHRDWATALLHCRRDRCKTLIPSSTGSPALIPLTFEGMARTMS